MGRGSLLGTCITVDGEIIQLGGTFTENGEVRVLSVISMLKTIS